MHRAVTARKWFRSKIDQLSTISWDRGIPAGKCGQRRSQSLKPKGGPSNPTTLADWVWVGALPPYPSNGMQSVNVGGPNAYPSRVHVGSSAH